MGPGNPIYELTGISEEPDVRSPCNNHKSPTSSRLQYALDASYTVAAKGEVKLLQRAGSSKLQGDLHCRCSPSSPKSSTKNIVTTTTGKTCQAETLSHENPPSISDIAGPCQKKNSLLRSELSFQPRPQGKNPKL